MSTGGLSVTATMLVGIDRFVASAADGIPGYWVVAGRVQPWLCAEALLGGAMWALWLDEAIDVRLPAGGKARLRLLRNGSCPTDSLERRVLAATTGRTEPAMDVLLRALGFAHGQPWDDVVDVVRGEINRAGPPADHADRAALDRAVDELSARWDAWWAAQPGSLSSVGRACHDALVAHRLRFARQVAGGFPLGARPYDPAEYAAELARPDCPRWARRI